MVTTLDYIDYTIVKLDIKFHIRKVGFWGASLDLQSYDIYYFILHKITIFNFSL